ncbi:hypothetical protein PSHT_00355 [Puccinia striiformis]|uniref:Uncharacterized protein n=2 Tax=Puccinia striiformis TaxID=27350 RepID=A0A2S4WN61_9BASI|nr:hypothetical protein PSTT_05658 [Puccinia striiformis]POW23174.1 hypothetical protein PSHT_00355 [Puccinia striiformis]
MAVMSYPNQTFYPPDSYSPLASRKQSAPIGPYQPPVTSPVHNHPYVTVAVVRGEALFPREILAGLGRFQESPEIEHGLPKLSKSQGFLNVFFTGEQHQKVNLKKLDSFLNRLIGNSPKTIFNSNIIRTFLQMGPMGVGAHWVNCTNNELCLCRIPLATDTSEHTGHTLVGFTTQLLDGSRTPPTTATCLAQPPAVTKPKHTSTPDSRLPYEAMLGPPPSTYPRAACSPAPPNSTPIERKTPQPSLQSQSPINPWARH